jgi:hypothetical protein
MTATAEASAAPEAAPAEQAAPQPFSASDLGVLLNGPRFENTPQGQVFYFWAPALERGFCRQARAEATDLQRPVPAAREQALAGEHVSEYRRRAEALRLARGQVTYFKLRIGELQAQRKSALAKADDAALASSEVNLAAAQAELQRFEGRAGALVPLVEQAQRLAEGALKAAVNSAHSAVVSAAARERDAAREALAGAVAAALPRLLAAQLKLEQLADRHLADRAAELPEEKAGAPPEGKGA